MESVIPQDEPLAPPTAVNLNGLTDGEAAQRRARGEGNNVRIETGRTYLDILKANFFTFINIILFVIGIIMVFLGLWGDAFVSVGVVLMNVIVGVVQEFRAKQKLDQITLLTRPKVTIRRDGVERTADPSAVVLGDIILAHAGDQIVVDGVVVGDGRMAVDESLLTGESDLISKKAGNEVLSGSFCVTGSAAYVATKVGADSFANKLTASAKQFRVELTPLQGDINFIVRILLLLATIIGLLFAGAYAVREVSTIQSVQSAAVIAGLVPAGLILMTTTAYAMGALRMTGQGALIQQANAVESMANVNVLCLDKTGTLTANRIVLDALHPMATDHETFKHIMGAYGCSTRAGNRTSDALAEGCGGRKYEIVDEIPFSSARKWSALAFDDDEVRGVYMLGAPEMVSAYLPDDVDYGKAQIEAWADEGLRVLLVAYSPEPMKLHNIDDDIMLPEKLQPFGLVTFTDELRPEAKETLAGFIKAGITPKIISGDNPDTVAALAKQAGLPATLRVVSGPELQQMDEAQIDNIVDEVTVFGRITPEQKEMLVDSLRRKGCYVAMIGDGVNDVLSLKKAQIGIAMQSGSAATRNVADIVLLNDSFAALPAAFMEGQRILNGMDDIIRLFLIRAFYAAIIILGAAVVVEAQLFPFIPKHASLITLVTIALPTFMLAAWAQAGVPKHNLLRSFLHFIIPGALWLAVVALSVYTFYLMTHYVNLPETATRAQELQAIAESRTALTNLLVLMGLFLLPFVEPPTQFWVGGDDYSGDWRPSILAVIMLVIYITLNVVPGLRNFFELEILDAVDYLFLVTVALLWAIVMRTVWRLHLFEHFLGMRESLRVKQTADG